MSEMGPDKHLKATEAELLDQMIKGLQDLKASGVTFFVVEVGFMGLKLPVGGIGYFTSSSHPERGKIIVEVGSPEVVNE